ncbi:MAG: transforming growth factor-beta-induced protein [Verrucomicrobiales bacterium]
MKTFFPTYLRAVTSFALILATLSYSTAADQTVTEFAKPENKALGWRIVDDGVMGGLSQGKVSFSAPGIMMFQGDLSLENNGGFSSVRTSNINLDLQAFEGFRMRVKGDGRSYQLRMATDERYRSGEVSFKASFPTTRGEWREVKVPFSTLMGSWRGQILKERKFDSSKIRQISLLLGDKKAGTFKLEVDWIRAYVAEGGGSNLVETAMADGRFETLVKALTQSELLNALQGDGPLTVFAPTDEAFDKLPEGTLAEILKPANQKQLQGILKYHVVSGKATLSDALKVQNASTLQGGDLRIAFDEGKVRINLANLLNADIDCSNGIIHVIDSVLLPPDPKPKNILEVAESAGSFDALLSAIDASGLRAVLEGDGPFTVFAPTDDAISKLPEDIASSLLEEGNREQLRSILSYHVINGKVSSGDALNSKTAKTVNGESVQFAVQDGRLKVNDSIIRTVDIPCSNGVIHVIDMVLIPPKDEEVQASATKKITVQQRILTAIDQGVPLYNKGKAAACAEVYEDCVQELVSDEEIGGGVRHVLAGVLDKAKASKDANSKAWILRQALDGTLASVLSN